jgi:hypothetical protein
MDKNIPIGETTKVVEILKPLSSEDRARVIRAAMVLLGETDSGVPLQSGAGGFGGDEVEKLGALPLRARAWMKQNSISAEQLQQVFHVAEGTVELIAQVPGRNKKEQTYNSYILTGLGQLLLSGNASFQDKSARALCEVSGCYDSANHSAYLKDKGNEFTGTKEKGWVLTAPGLKRGADIVKEMQNAS